MSVTPYGSGSGKKKEVEQMFDQIAPKYDFLNHFLSVGIDIQWRKKAIREISRHPHDHILDIATGTGDLAIAAMKINPDSITGIDLSAEMLAIAEKKVAEKKDMHLKFIFKKEIQKSYHWMTTALMQPWWRLVYGILKILLPD